MRTTKKCDIQLKELNQNEKQTIDKSEEMKS